MSPIDGFQVLLYRAGFSNVIKGASEEMQPHFRSEQHPLLTYVGRTLIMMVFGFEVSMGGILDLSLLVELI